MSGENRVVWVLNEEIEMLQDYPLLDALVDKPEATVAVCRQCNGAVVLAVTEHISKETCDDLTIAAAKGASIQHMTLDESRQLHYGCTCKRIKK